MSPGDPSVEAEIAIYENTPCEGTRTFCSIGLYSADLILGDKVVKQELVMAAGDDFDRKEVAAFLSTVTDDIRSSGEALAGSDIVEMEFAVTPGTQMRFVFACSDAVMPDDIPRFPLSRPGVSFVRVVPIHDDEADLAVTDDWQKLEDAFRKEKADLSDLHRESIF